MAREGYFVRAVLCTVAVAALAGAGQRPARTFDLSEVTVAELQRRMTSGQETARSIAEKYLARIEDIDRSGPALHSVIELNPDALTLADQLDAERRARGPRGPLHGIPILIKDNIATGDRMQTTAGSLALVDSRPAHDAAIVVRLRQAGAVILGKTNLSEWANFRSTHSTSGWSARGGLTKNPYALDRNPSGSSSGSAVAMAANLAAVAIGTETDGSIVSPSNSNGIVGIKPTVGLWSRTGIVPISATQDTAGPMARTVADAVALLGPLSAEDAADPATRGATRHRERDYTKYLDAGGLRGARIGVVRNKLFGYSPAADEIAAQAIADMKKAGAVIVDPVTIPTIGTFDDTELQVLLYEFKDGLRKYLAWVGPRAKLHGLVDVIAFNRAHADEELRYFGQELMLQAEAKGPLTESRYRAALAKDRQASRTMGIDAAMKRYRLDALVAPTGAPAWLTDLVNGDMVSGSASTIAAVAGYPHITVPAGFSRGLPVGVSFIGSAWSEPALIRIAYSYEQVTKRRRPPTLAATADVR